MALAFDGATKDFVKDATTGRFSQARHWVDNAVFIYLWIEQGSVRSAPQVGQTVTKIKYIDKNKTPQIVRDRAMSALTPLLKRNLIRVKSIDVDLSHRGRILYQVNYVNLVTQKPQQTPQLEAA